MTNQRLKEITAELNRTTSDEIVGVSYGYNTVGGKTTSEKVIIFTVIRKKPLSEIPENERIPSQLEVDGEIFNTDVIEGSIKAFAYSMCNDPVFYDWMANAPGNRNTHRPLMGGVSITNFTALGNYVGTMGFIAVDNETNSLVGVTNNHVICDDAFYTTDRNVNDIRTNVWTPNGHRVTQPNEVGNFGIQNTVGVVKRYQPISPIPYNNEVDCALVSINVLDDQGDPTIDPAVSWNQFGITGLTQTPRFATTQELDVLLQEEGRVFYSTGRTTGPKGEGATKLFCTATNSSIAINYDRQGLGTTCYMNDTFELQASGVTTPQGDWCYYPSNSGDSGSAILTELVPGEYVIVGLLYGGRQVVDPENPENYLPTHTLCNRIDNIVRDLNIRHWDGTMNGIFYGNPGAAETYVHQGTSSDKFKIINGVRYWQMGLVENSEYPFDPTPVPTATPIPTATPLPPTATPVPPTATPIPPTDTPVPSPTDTPSPTPTPAPQTLNLNYDHLNSCSTSNLILSVNGVQQGANINLSQGSSASGTVRGPISVYPGDQVSLQYKPFNLISPCTLSYQNPTVEVFLNGVSVGTNSNDSVYNTYNYTVQAGVNPTILVEMNSFPVPTATPLPTYTLTLQDQTINAENCAKGYVTVEKNGSVVATLTKTQQQTSATWNVSSITFTPSDNVYIKSYSQGGGGAGCATTDTTVRAVYNGSAKTTSTVDANTNGQSFTIPDANGTATGWFFEVGGI